MTRGARRWLRLLPYGPYRHDGRLAVSSVGALFIRIDGNIHLLRGAVPLLTLDAYLVPM